MPHQPRGMPTRLPVIPGLSVDAQYAVTGVASSGGRAWFDVLALPDGRAAMLVGDSVEQGIPPAVVAPDLRSRLGHLLAESRDLAPALEQLKHWGATTHERYATTACVAVVDPRDGRVEYGTSGHHPPLKIEATGRTRYLEPTRRGNLGTDPPAATGTTRLFGAEVLVLCTDGLSPETRNAMTAGLADLSEAEDESADESRNHQHGVRTAAVCRTTTQALRRSSNRSGLAVIAVAPRSIPPRLEITVPAIAASLETAREAVGNWLSGLRSSVEDGAGMALAVGEALANAVQHAFIDTRTGTVSIEASLLSDGVLSCSVRDDGRWLGPESVQPEPRGRGLALMERVSDWMELSRGPGGTVVKLRRRLHHPVLGDAEIGPQDV